MITWSTIRMAAAMVTLLALGGAGLAPATAQDSTVNLYETLPGVETVHARMYAREHDLAADLAATPEPAGEYSPTSQLIVTVLQFETADQVTSAFAETLNDDIAKQVLGAVETGFIASEDIEGTGDWAHIYVCEAPSGEPYPIRGLLLVQDGNLGFMIQSFAENDSTLDQMTAIAEFMVKGEPVDEAIVVDASGMASGGTFDIMPGSEDGKLLGDLAWQSDYDLLISGSPMEPSATPQS